MNTRVIKSIAFLALFSSPFLVTANSTYQNIQTFTTSFDRPEEAGKEYRRYDRDAISGDLMGDGVIPERDVMLYSDTLLGDGFFEYKDYPTQANFMVKDAHNVYYDGEDEHKNAYQDRTNGHETYKNYFKLAPEEGAYKFDNETNKYIAADEHLMNIFAEDVEVIERTPMRGIVPFGEGTNEFNTYILEETNNGTAESDELYFDEYYSEYINEYTSNSKGNFPIIYKYLEDPTSMNKIFLDDNVEGVLPENGSITDQDSLTNAFVGFDSNGNIYKTELYLEDYVIGNGNNNVYPYKDPNLMYYDNLYSDLNPDNFNVSFSLARADLGFTTVMKAREEEIKNPENPLLKANFNELEVHAVMLTNESKDTGREDTQNMGFINEDTTHIGSHHYSGTPTYNGKGDKDGYYGLGAGDYFYLYNPMKQQMNVDIQKTILDFSELESNYEKTLSSTLGEELLQESTVAEFRTIFEDGLINSTDGINKDFIEFYNTNGDAYYSNFSEDGTKFLGRNRLQTGIYPVEDIRLNDLIITYTDQDGNILKDTTLLGDVTDVNVEIAYNTNTENAALFDASSVETTTINFDTTNLETNITTPTDNNGNSHLLLIILISIFALLLIAGIVAGIVFAKKK